jgi:hypothetical protein
MSENLIHIAEKYLSENNIIVPHLQCERVSLGLSLRLKEMGIANKIRVAECFKIRWGTWF